MFAFINNSQIAAVVPEIPEGADVEDYMPVVDGALPTLTTSYSSVVERPVNEWTIGASQVTRTFSEYIPSPSDQVAIQAARDVLPLIPKRKYVMEILRDALATETEPDFTLAGIATSAIALPSHITGSSGLNQAQVDARVVAGITGKADTAHNHDATYAVLSHDHTGVYQPTATVLTNTTASFTAAQEAKLSGIATAATANSADATLLARANHTGTQTAATISDFSTAADARISAASVNDLADVTVSSPSAGQVLKWNGSAWINDTDSTSAGATPCYTLSVQALTSSPADGATIYIGANPKAPSTTAATNKVYIPKTGTIKRADIYCYSGTAGTAEAWTANIRKNNSADTAIATVSTATQERVFSNAALNLSVTAGDYIEVKISNPAWSVNPLTTTFGGQIYIET